MRARLAGQGGFTLIELLVALILTGIVMTAVVTIFLSGSRAGADANARVDAQQSTRVALDRLEFEARCASDASLLSSGAGVALTLPTQCAHAAGSVSWCVESGELVRYAASSCTGSGQPFVDGVTSVAPFSLTSVSGDLPRLGVELTVNTGGSGDGATLDDTITLRNASPVA
jgi:prepilin-type N-terminal cleavage/methylation domain-containing protein